ncbi:CNNM domain-containing protein [Streptomyces eurythermus]
MTIPLLLLAAAFLLILANGFFVAAEFGLVTVERPDAEKAAADGDPRARTVVESLKELSFQLSGTQLGITITSLVVGMLAEPALAELLRGPFTAVGVPEGAAAGIAVVVGMLLASAIQMVIGELVPKNWAVSRPLQVARFVAGPQHRFALLFRPVISALNTVANRLVRALGVEPTEELASARTPGELVSLARHSALAGALEQDTADLFVDTLARRLMAQLVRALAAHVGTQAAASDLYVVHSLVLDVAERRGLPREKAAALLNLGDLDAQTGRTREALARYRAALDAGREANDPYATGRAMESVGGAHQELGDHDRAADWFGRALAERLARGEVPEAARLYGRIATAHTYAGRYGEALRNWRAALAGYRRSGDVAASARALSEIARVQEYAGRPEESLRTCQEAVEWARRAEDARLQAAVQLRLADTLDRLGDPAAARLHRAAAERMLAEERPEDDARAEQDANACEIRTASSED